ncbi:fungal-specific transcription factor domain-containing protein [Crucibulum laeve]|uniref:Fungal-specific transcription factor domain-containing protein n=1 Tax=Crucibulum laeve TaxID=68775 RepID=A0A5C3MCF2_9AGAR|nr:fungal-specific transcription factor domain-containing protein [Crucibulum laeve]
MDPLADSMSDTKSNSKSPVVRGARACTVCRAAKMKCVGAEDGQKQCQRCKRANVECVFEKHRRGRKPGSKLSEASKMLRRLEKGLNSAKMKSQSSDPALGSPYHTSDSRAGGSQDGHYPGRSTDSAYSTSTSRFPNNEQPPVNMGYQSPDGYPPPPSAVRSMDVDDDDDDEDPERNEDSLYPVKLIKRENRHNSFFKTILNPEETPASATSSSHRRSSYTPPLVHHNPIPNGMDDPITAGIITEDEAKTLFDAIYIRLNPFINLFDPALHTVSYIRSRSPFLFTTLIMAACKFFRPPLFKQCQKLANEYAVRAFQEGWKSVEVVQAFACLTYWKDPEDNRTWTYIGYACRMAVELNLNRYVPNPSLHESEIQRLERRNRERTYLVLFIHDRSLSTQTGRHWMLPEDDLIRHSSTWHQENKGPARLEDVIIAALLQLRRIASETTDIFTASKSSSSNNNGDINHEVVLHACNAKLAEWDNTWHHEMERANGEKFHQSFLSFFRLYVTVFLNSYGIQSAMSPSSRQSPSMQALSTCCASALESLRIIAEDFAAMNILSYGQDSLTTMTAYSAVFLLKLLRIPSIASQLPESTAVDIHKRVADTAEAYRAASLVSSASPNAAYHARFLQSLLTNDIFQKERHHTSISIDPRLRVTSHVNGGHPNPHSPIYTPHSQPMHDPSSSHPSFQFPASPHPPTPPNLVRQHPDYNPELSARHNIPASNGNMGTHYQTYPMPPPNTTEQDTFYWRSMFRELGFGENSDSSHPVPVISAERHNPQYVDNSQQQYHPSQQMSYHHHQPYPSSVHQSYGH